MLEILGTGIYRDGRAIMPVLASAFALFREDVPIEKTKKYIDDMYNLGIRGFRVWNLLVFEDGTDIDYTSGWVWGGTVCPKENQDRSCLNEPYFKRVDEVLTYLKSKNMYCLWALVDASAYISGMSASWYSAQDDGWILYLDRISQIWNKYSNILIISTGNEPPKGNPNYNAVRNHQLWIVDCLWDRGIRNIAGNGQWIKEFKSNSRVQILEIASNRTPDDSCIQKTIDELNDMLAYGKPVINSEPPRASSYYGWPRGDTYYRDLLQQVAQATIDCQCWYCHHGIGSGEIDDLVSQGGQTWWGVTCKDNNALDTDWLSIVPQLNMER